MNVMCKSLALKSMVSRSPHWRFAACALRGAVRPHHFWRDGTGRPGLDVQTRLFQGLPHNASAQRPAQPVR